MLEKTLKLNLGTADVEGPMNMFASGPQFVKSATAPRCVPLASRHSCLLNKKCVSIFQLDLKVTPTLIQGKCSYMNLILIRVKQSEEGGLNVPCLPELDKVVIMDPSIPAL